MLRRVGTNDRPSKQIRPWKDDDAVRRQERISLTKILEFGFICNNGYSDPKTSWDRYYVVLKDGVTVDQLLDFCVKHMKGTPIPEIKLENGPVHLKMFEAAKYDARLVDIEFNFGDYFLPELGRIG